MAAGLLSTALRRRDAALRALAAAEAALRDQAAQQRALRRETIVNPGRQPRIGLARASHQRRAELASVVVARAKVFRKIQAEAGDQPRRYQVACMATGRETTRSECHVAVIQLLGFDQLLASFQRLVVCD